MLKMISQRITETMWNVQMPQVARGLATKDRRPQKKKNLLPVHHRCRRQASACSQQMSRNFSFTTGPLAPQPSWGTSQTVGRQRGRHHYEQVWPRLCSTFASRSCAPPSLTEPSPRASSLFEKQEAISWSTSPDGVCDFPHAHGKSFRTSY